MGENGAGKSTLIKVLTGVYASTPARSRSRAEPVHLREPARGAAGRHQHRLPGSQSLPESLRRGEHLHRPRAAEARAASSGGRCGGAPPKLLERVDVDVDVLAPLGRRYSLAVQQMVAIARAIDISADVLILDEPTSSLDRGEVEQLFAVMRQLVARASPIVFVSHFLDQVYEISDRMTVLRNGRLVGEWTAAELSRVELVTSDARPGAHDAGGARTEAARRAASARADDSCPRGQGGRAEEGDRAVRPRHSTPARSSAWRGCSGPGRTELARLLFGADRADSGKVHGRRAARSRSGAPRAATAKGVAFCPENRRTEGLIEDLTVRENIVLALQAARGWTRSIPRKRQDELVEHWITALDIRPPTPSSRCATSAAATSRRCSWRAG